MNELKLLCKMANSPPGIERWNAFFNRFIDLIFQHNAREDDAGKFARHLIRQIDSLWVFLEVHGIEPTNNRAERALRFGVLSQRYAYSPDFLRSYNIPSQFPIIPKIQEESLEIPGR